MAPPAGTSSMLRYRRRDATLKPNRTLDRSASRGMLYENEELRLRTININAEVEKGQNYIKKLRRENEHLKREIWNLREEYERLENYVKSREQSENEEEIEDDDEGGGGGDDGETVTAEQPMTEVVVATETAVSLETVLEEDDQQLQDQQDRQNLASESTDRGGKFGPQDSIAPGAGDTADNVTGSVAPRRDEARAETVTADAVASDVARGGDRPHQPEAVDGQDVPPPPWPTAAVGQPQHLDAAVLQPHTACFETGNNRQLHDLTVDEVIDAVKDAELRDKLRSVCLTDDRCYMTFANAEYLERALHTALGIRDVPVLLMDTGAGAVILSLTGVPDAVSDKEVLKCLKKYGTIIGGVDRKTARGGTTGVERYVRVRPTLGAPRYLWFGSDKVIVRQLTEHETGTMNSVARRKSFRSQIKLNLKMAGDASTGGGGGDDGGSDESSCNRENNVGTGTTGGGGGGGTGTTGVTAVAAVSAQNGFRFPTDSKTTATAEPKTATTTTGSFKSTGSPKKSKAGGNDCPPTAGSVASGPAESPLRGRRKASLMGFRRETVKHRGGSVSRADGGEDADSDTSTICRRKLSIITGREGTEKVPWCGCWGNGCL